MQLADPHAQSTAYLILRDLYNGDVIDWPIADDHPLHGVFAALEEQKLIARWDRMWPRRDRYRLTEAGIATIEAVYRPDGAEQVFDELRRQALAPAERRAHLAARGLDPAVWPLLHDPSTHWETFGTDGGRWLSYVWEDQRPEKRKRRGAAKAGSGSGPRTTPGKAQLPDDVYDPTYGTYGAYGSRDDVLVAPYVVDLDREASQEPLDVSLDVSPDVSPDQPDLDVS
ncbi:MAG TPA: hypothetical protein VNO30_08170 [Kofleriaceae bacterium]|nr:hypothetical protein [Kofleriaceae bacterium]